RVGGSTAFEGERDGDHRDVVVLHQPGLDAARAAHALHVDARGASGRDPAADADDRQKERRYRAEQKRHHDPLPAGVLGGGAGVWIGAGAGVAGSASATGAGAGSGRSSPVTDRSSLNTARAAVSTSSTVTAAIRSGQLSTSSIVRPVTSASPRTLAPVWRLSRAKIAAACSRCFAAATSSSVTPSRTRFASTCSTAASTASSVWPCRGTS